MLKSITVKLEVEMYADADGEVEVTLPLLNDNGYSFEEIHDLVEEHL